MTEYPSRGGAGAGGGVIGIEEEPSALPVVLVVAKVRSRLDVRVA